MGASCSTRKRTSASHSGIPGSGWGSLPECRLPGGYMSAVLGLRSFIPFTDYNNVSRENSTTTSPGALYQSLGVLQRLRRQLLPRQHPPNFARAALAVQFFDSGHSAPLALALLHALMMIRESRDLRQVRHAQNLIRGGEFLQPPSDALRRAAADARVHFVEHQRTPGHNVV
jgi:hypothetical protein